MCEVWKTNVIDNKDRQSFSRQASIFKHYRLFEFVGLKFVADIEKFIYKYWCLHRGISIYKDKDKNDIKLTLSESRIICLELIEFESAWPENNIETLVADANGKHVIGAFSKSTYKWSLRGLRNHLLYLFLAEHLYQKALLDDNGNVFFRVACAQHPLGR